MAYPTGYITPVTLTPGSTTAIVAGNTSAIQSAIDNTPNSLVGQIVCPAGLYKINPITMKENVELVGAGSGGYLSTVDNNQTHLNLVTDSTHQGHMFRIPINTPNVKFRDLFLDGGLQSNNPNSDVIHVDDAASADQTSLRLERVQINQAGNYGMYVGTFRDDVKMHHSQIMGSYNTGLLTKGPDGVYDSCEFGSNGRNLSGSNIIFQAVVNRVVNSDIWGDPANGIAVNGVVILTGITGCAIIGCGIDRHQRQGVYIYDGCYSNTVFGNVFHSNSQVTDNLYAHCYNGSNHAGGVLFDGNSAISDSAYEAKVASWLLQSANTANSLVGTCNYAVAGSSGAVGVRQGIHN